MTLTRRTDEVPHQWPELLGELTGGCLRPGGLELTSRLLSDRLPPGSFVLEIGCGCGRSLSYMRQERGLCAVGLDLSAFLLERLRQSSHAPLVRADAAFLPVRDACLDGVLCECVLSLMPRPDLVLQEIARVLRPGGYLFCTDLYARAPGRGARGEAPEDARCCIDGAVPRTQWLELLQEKSLQPEVWEDHSQALAQLAGELIFAYGTLESFWRTLLPAEQACRVVEKASVVKPGYSLTVARKR